MPAQAEHCDGWASPGAPACRSHWLAVATVLGLALVAGLGACGSGQRARSAAFVPVAPSRCTQTVVATLAQVARRVYSEAAGGRTATQARQRVEGSADLARAVARDDPAATRSAAQGLRAGQIVALQVRRGNRLLADLGTSPVLAPVSGALRDAGGHEVGRFVLSVQADHGYLNLIQRITGAQVLLRNRDLQVAATTDLGPAPVPDQGTVTLRGEAYEVVSFAAEAFPSGPLHVSLLIPVPLASACAGTDAQTVADTLGAVAMRVYDEERASQYVSDAARYVASSRLLATAAARNDAAGMRRAIVGFFNSHIHIVRVRVTRGAQVLTDIGGPYVLAPVSTALIDARGNPVAQATFAVQDDLGYVILIHRFTGAQVLLSTHGHQIMGTLIPGPAQVPDRGPFVYAARHYDALSFTREAFPFGPLRISVLAPAGAP